MAKKRVCLIVKGAVQGVGFRPFVYNLACSLNLAGWVVNTAQGVKLEAEGEEKQLGVFIEKIRADCPPLAVIDDIKASWLEAVNYRRFEIKKSVDSGSKFTLVLPDTATCPQCLEELNDPGDRRYQYPFINCTNCGPRFTIIKDVPYDRAYTTMNEFIMCRHCSKEYHEPKDRRFHAQPNACPQCGPQVCLLDSRGRTAASDNPLAAAVKLLSRGKILAIKGLGGYHLACSALSSSAVKRLRKLKNRPHKPLAVMMPDLQAVKKHCFLNSYQQELLAGSRRPIVLLEKKPGSSTAPEVAPGSRYLGVMIPYTPLHHLLFSGRLEALVMTSGNLNGDAIEYNDKEALANLGRIADYFLTHNRKIYTRADDSVARVFRNREMVLRRSRGYVPLPIKVPVEASGVLAVGGNLKNTVCLTKNNMAFLSQHNGDLESLSCISAFHQAVNHLQKIFHAEPRVIAYDQHPGYYSTRYALEKNDILKIPVQHHHAHIASCMAENGLCEEVIGVAFDGTGYGCDGTIWGGEFLTAGYHNFTRWAHLQQVPLPGGDAAVKEPWRMALSYLVTLLGNDSVHPSLPFLNTVEKERINIVKEMIVNRVNSVPTSSAGRLFDGTAALLGLRQTVSYEGQAAVELEHAASTGNCGKCYRFYIDTQTQPWTVNLKQMFKEMVEDIINKCPPELTAARFHKTVAEIIAVVCSMIRHRCGIKKAVLSGGVMQNITLLNMTVDRLEQEGFEVYTHSRVPPNDGGLSLGQAVVAGAKVFDTKD